MQEKKGSTPLKLERREKYIALTQEKTKEDESAMNMTKC
jgi:hypothetical protein